ncbi:hypothetical protein [Halosimplex marinum]|uniref:hypothetical protein n=1 Tax=Halosimplex marinum TaxID=3396620 RepID=UPI003F55C14F
MSEKLDPRIRASRYLDANDDVDVPELAGALGVAPVTAREILDDLDTGADDGTPTVEPDGYHIPEPLKDYDVWVVWCPDLGKTARAPWQNGHMYPAEWAEDGNKDPRRSYDKAASVASLPVGEIADTWPFPDETPDTVKPAVLIPPASVENDLLFVDFDDVRDPETGEVPAEVWEIIDDLGGYAEVSSSGEGLHVWVRGELPGDYGKFIEPLDAVGQIEMYDRGRMTGGTWRHVQGTPKDEIPEAQGVVDELVARYETEECPECETAVRSREIDADTPECPECGSSLEEDTGGDVSDDYGGSGGAGVGDGRENDKNPYYQIELTDVADTGPFKSHREDTSNPSPSDWQGPHPKHGGTSRKDEESTNFNVDDSDGEWHCFAHGSGGGALSLIAVLEGIVSCRNADRVHSKRETLLKACLAARDHYAADLEGETPPYEALVAVAEWADLRISNPEEGILGETAHRYAREIFKELSYEEV